MKIHPAVVVSLAALIAGASMFPANRPISHNVALDSIVKIECKLPDKEGKPAYSVGTGFIVAENMVITASHVIQDSLECNIYGVPVTVMGDDALNDYAVLQVNTGKLQPLSLSCDGFNTGETYYAIGFINGEAFTMNRLKAGHLYKSGKIIHNTRELRGSASPGMSGGPIVNQDGYVVGITLATSLNGPKMVYSRELFEVPVCKK